MIENDIKLLEHCVLDLQHRVQVLEDKIKQTQRRVIVLECKADRKTEPLTNHKKWDAPSKVDLPTGEITTCVSVLASAFEEASQAERERMSDESRRTDKETEQA